MLKHIDDFLLDKLFQPATDWVCDLTGLNCFAQASYVYRMMTVVSLVRDVLAARSMVDKCVFAFVVLLFQLFLAFVVASVRTIHKDGFINSRRAVCFNGRMILTFGLGTVNAIVFLADPDDIYPVVTYSLLVMGEYALSCTPRPPRPLWQPRLVAVPT